MVNGKADAASLSKMDPAKLIILRNGGHYELRTRIADIELVSSPIVLLRYRECFRLRAMPRRSTTHHPDSRHSVRRRAYLIYPKEDGLRAI